ncbi:MAG: metallophosphoesterase [Cyclobacteriaceae bacterium]
MNQYQFNSSRGHKFFLFVLVLTTVVSCTQPVKQTNPFVHDLGEGATPWSFEPTGRSDSSFTFAIITDLNGGEREGIFDVAVQQISLLQPEFILSVGDLVDGSEDISEIKKQYGSFDERAAKAKAPVFHVGGNHDLTNNEMRDFWKERYGRLYYYFIYQNVLFLMLDTEDYDEAFRQKIHAAREEAIAILDGDHPEDYPSTEYFNLPERVTGKIEEEQNAYFEKVIADHPNVKWTFVLMHKPVWQREGEGNLSRIEAALGSRDYTVINGHFHSYSYTQRNERDYIMLGTTGGSQNANDPNSFDHITLVSFDKNGPALANIRMDGLLDKTGRIPLDGEKYCYQASECKE